MAPAEREKLIFAAHSRSNYGRLDRIYDFLHSEYMTLIYIRNKLSCLIIQIVRKVGFLNKKEVGTLLFEKKN